jgi:hypothetical protein
MSASTYWKNFAHSTLVFSDGTAGTPLTHTADTDLGTLQITGMVPGLRESSNYERKGNHVSTAFTTRKYPEMTVTFALPTWKDTANGTISDFILATAGTPFAARVSVAAPTGATQGKIPFAYNLAAALEGTDYGDASDSSGTLTKCKVTDFNPLAEGDPNEISLSAQVLGAITGDFAASEA